MSDGSLWINVGIAAGWLSVAGLALLGLHLSRTLPDLRIPIVLIAGGGVLLALRALDYAADLVTLVASAEALELAAAALIAGGFAHAAVSGRRLHDEMLRRAAEEAGCRALLEQSADGLYQSMPDGRVLRANTAFARIFGFADTSATDPDNLDVGGGLYILPDRRRRFLDALAESGELRDFESQIRRRDGALVWISECARLLRDASGAPLYIEGKVSDVTTRKRLEAERDRVFLFANDILCLVRRDGAIDRVNPAFERALGYDAQQLSGRRLFDLFHADDARAAAAEFAKLAEGLPIVDFVARCRALDGGYRALSWTLIPSTGEQAQAVARDLTERRSIEEQLRLAQTVFDTASEAIIVTDAEQRILKVNHAFTTITGYREDEMLGQTPRILSSGRQEAGFYEAMAAMLATTGHWQGEVWNRRKNGELYVEWLSFAAVRDTQGGVVNFVGVFSDITRHKQDEERIRHQANHDALTQLPNRWLFQARLAQAIDRCRADGRKLALVHLNLNQFKFVNDSLGHRAGDELLKEVSRRLSRIIRHDDTLARLGGDEFAVIVEDFRDDEPIEMLPARMLKVVAEPFDLDGSPVVIGVALGIALFPGDGGDADALARNAAIAMRHAKEQGTSAHRFFDDRMESRSLERFKLEARLRRAIEGSEFQVHYQAQIDLTTRGLIGAEALIRWTDPELGPMSPAYFIPAAEASGLIVEIGQWVLREVCRQILAWQTAGFTVPRIAVNLSFQQFRRPDFLDTVKAIIAESGIDARQLEFELTESVVMHDAEQAISTLTALRDLGVELAIDDFGTGYSSLNRLRRMPIHTLKIDRSFIHDVTRSEEDATIVSAIVSMAHSLNLKVVAEGVETEAQLAFLAGKRCNSAQGFLLSRPIPAPDFARLMQTWTGEAMPGAAD